MVQNNLLDPNTVAALQSRIGEVEQIQRVFSEQ
jgi:hypothetical protein